MAREQDQILLFLDFQAHFESVALFAVSAISAVK